MRITIYIADGREMLRTVKTTEHGSPLALDISRPAPGSYVLQATSVQGKWEGRSNFVVVR